MEIEPRRKPENHVKPTPGEQAINKLISMYNNRAYGTPTAPLISSDSFDYTDKAGNLGSTRTYRLEGRDGNTIGALSRSKDTTQYDLLASLNKPVFGNGEFDKSLYTPVGNFSVEYDGDTLWGNYNMPSRDYYMAALNSLLNRGK